MAAFSLATLKIAIAGRSTSLAGPQLVRVHPQAHAAPGITPLSTGSLEYFVQPFGFGLQALCRALRDEAPGADPDAIRAMKQMSRERTRKLYRWLLETDLALKGTHSSPVRSRFALDACRWSRSSRLLWILSAYGVRPPGRLTIQTRPKVPAPNNW